MKKAKKKDALTDIVEQLPKIETQETVIESEADQQVVNADNEIITLGQESEDSK